MKACIGSTNRAKILGAQKALRLIGVSEIIPVKVETGIDQPIGFKEMLELAIFRAEEALKRASADYGVGIEGGVLFDVGYPIEGQVAIVLDREGFFGIGFSSLFPLPREFSQLLKKYPLGEIMAMRLGIRDIGKTYGAIGYFTMGDMTRIELSYQATLMAIIPFLKKGFFKERLKIADLKKILKTLNIMDY